MSSEPAHPASRRPSRWPLAVATVLTALACRQIGKIALHVSLGQIHVREASQLGAAWGLFFGLAVSAVCWRAARRCWASDPDDSPSVLAPTVLGGLFVISPILVALISLTLYIFNTGRLPTFEDLRRFGGLALLLGLLFALVLGLFAGPVAAGLWQLGVWAARRWPTAEPAQPPPGDRTRAPSVAALIAGPPRRWPLAGATLLVAAGYMYSWPIIFPRCLAHPPADPAAAQRLAEVLGLLLGCILSFLAWRTARRAWSADPACRPAVARAVLVGGLAIFAALLAVPILLALFAWLLGPFPNAAVTYRRLHEGGLVVLRLGLILGLVGGYLAGLLWTLAVRLARPRI